MSTKVYDNHLHMMEELGGSFVRSLVNCYYAADSMNKQKLIDTFSEYFTKYEELYKQHVRVH